MAGLMIDVDIMLLLLQKYFPDLISALEDNFFMEYFKNVLFQWFLSLFIHNFSMEAGLIIWDILFIDKYIVLFKAVIGLIKYIYKDIISGKIGSLEHFRNFLKDSFNNYSDISFLLYFISLRKFEFNTSFIEKNRIFLEPQTIQHINQINTHKLEKLKQRIKIMDEDCNLDWQICIYDAEATYRVTEHFVYKSKEKLEIIENYFDYHNMNYKNYYYSNETNISGDIKNNKRPRNNSLDKKSKYKNNFSRNYAYTNNIYYNYNLNNDYIHDEENCLNTDKITHEDCLKYSNILIERRPHICDVSKRTKKSKIPSSYSIVLDQLNDIENDEIVNISTGAEDKSNDISIERSVDKSAEKCLEDHKHIEENEYASNNSSNSKLIHLSRKKLYKDMKLKSKKCLSFNEHTPEKDFQTFVSKINLRHNMISQTKSFFLKNFDMNQKVSSSGVSFDI